MGRDPDNRDEWKLSEALYRFGMAYQGSGGGKLRDAADDVGLSVNYVRVELRHNRELKALLEARGLKTNTAWQRRQVGKKFDRMVFYQSVMDDETRSIGDRMRAAEHLGKLSGDYVDKQQVETNVTGQVDVIHRSLTERTAEIIAQRGADFLD